MRSWRLGLALGVLAVLAVVLVPAGSATAPSSGVKQFTGCLAKAATPATCDTSALPGGQAVPLTLTIGNALTSNQPLGSVNLDVPTGISIVLANPAPAYVANTGVAGQNFGTNTSTELQLRNLNLPPGSSVSVNFTVTTPCSGSNLKWGPLSNGPQVKQANNFSGTGNDFANTTAGNGGFTSGITAGGAAGTPDHLGFSVQPSDAGKATAISPAVKVTMYDVCGNVTNQADTTNVTLALVQPVDQTFGGGGALSGTLSRPLSSGVATFDDLKVDTSGIGYALKASYPNLSDVTSSTFNVYDSYGSCTSGCATGNGTTQLQIVGVNGAGNTGIGLGGANNTASCGNGLTPLGSTFVIVPPANASGNITAILTIGKRGLQGIGVSNIVVCKNAGPGTPLAQLGPCAKKNPSPPCILSQTSSNAGDAKITMLITASDPGGSGFG